VATINLQIPANTCSGSYYVFFWADGNQAVSESSDGNNFASRIITVNGTAPTTQAGNLSFTNVSGNSMTVNWNNGNGSRRVVKLNTSSSFTAPANGSDPAANSVYGGAGEQVVYNGTGNSVTITGLTAGPAYCFRVYELHCSGSNTVYNTNTGTNNPACQTVATALPVVDGLEAFTVSPNPGNGLFRVNMKLRRTKAVSFTVYNALGETVYRSAVYQVSGNTGREIDLGKIAAGAYRLQTFMDKQSFITTLIVQ
jgi:Purple acid Phosphatase, N-terminal domain/Secretion system C-terminal sorting domain